MNRRILSRILLLTTLAASLGTPAAVAGTAECQDEVTRARAALLRARRSHARAGIALLRIQAELRSIGRGSAASLAVEPETVAAPMPEDAGLEALSLGAWELRRRTGELSARAVALMEPFDVRQKPTLELGPRLPDEEERLLKPTTEEAQPCRAWIFYAQRAAFRAEQAAQLAEIAADQAITIAKLERDKSGR